MQYVSLRGRRPRPAIELRSVWGPIPTVRRADIMMRLSEEQVIGFLCYAQAGRPIKDACRGMDN